ncbi:MAG: hypothetical protein FWG82_03270 [Oscillospiraceae bacterium]|nr:hypothetical protein [Oscillospiraceae bacterium]
MPDYKVMYFHLAGRIAGAVEALEAVIETLKNAQQVTEDMFINSDEENDLDKNSEKA